jgi:hypothetical protein
MFGNQAIAINWRRSGTRAAAAAGSAIILLAVLCSAAAKADDLDLLRSVLNAAEGHDQAGWAYSRTLIVDAGAAGETEKVTVIEKFDPSKPLGEQRHRVEIREEDGKITTEQNDDLDVDVDRVVYADLTEIEFENAELVSDSADEAIYRLYLEEGEEFRFGGANFEGSSLMDNVFGELVITKSGPAAPYVSEVRLLKGESSGSLFAEIEELDISYRFSPSPDGTTYLSQGLNLKLEMEVLIFIDIEVNISSEYSNYAYVGEYGG